jgi:hypothetical protein
MISTEYNEERKPDDVDLVRVVRELLIGVGQAPKIHLFEQNDRIQEATNKRPKVQRYLMNEYWSLQIMKMPVNSIDIRYCLVNNGTIDDWIRLFRDKVLPFIMEFDLPIY